MSDETIMGNIEPKTQLHGVVKRIELTGAILDVGLDYDALLHVSQLKRGRGGNVRESLELGQEIDVWVRSVDDTNRCIDVSMIRPPEVEWQSIEAGQTYTGKVVRIKKFGAFIDIGAERPGLVHISELAHDYVAKPQDKVKKGDEVAVKVIGVDASKRQIDLSMKALEEAPVQQYVQEIEAEDEGTHIPTAMELAFQRARERNDDDGGNTGKKSSATAGKQDDILKRTLQQHEDSN